MIYNKKGAALGKQILIVWFLFILVIIGLATVGGVFLFYGSGYDFRQVDANVLHYQIKRCILSEKINWDSEDDFYSKCEISEDVFKENNLARVVIDDKEVFNWKGDETACRLASKNIEFPRCKIEEFVFSGKDYKIIAGSNQFARRVPG